MKQIIFTSMIMFCYVFVTAQTPLLLEAPNDTEEQLLLRSFGPSKQDFSLIVQNDGNLKFLADGSLSSVAMEIDDGSLDVTVYGEINIPAGSSNMIAKAYGSYTDIAGTGMHNQSSTVVSMTKITTGTDRVRIKFNGNYAGTLAVTATPIQNDISSGYFCSIAYVDADEIDVYVHLLNGSDAGDQSFSFVAFARD